MDLKKQVQFIKGVGPSRVKLLNKLGIYTLEDLITYYPRAYEDRSKPKNIAELRAWRRSFDFRLSSSVE